MTAKRRSRYVMATMAMLIITLAMCLSACFNTQTIISFSVDGGSPCESITIDAETESVSLPTPVKDGYVFLGWYSDMGLTEKVSSELSGENLPTVSTTFYASWEIKKINIVFIAGNETVKSFVVDYNTVISVEDFPSLENYPGYEWKTTSFKAQYDRTISAVAVSVEEPNYKVEYYIPSEAGYVLYEQYEGKTGTAINTPQKPLASTQYGLKYFKGWYFDKDGKELCSELPSSIPEKSIVLYGIFKSIGDDSKYLFYEQTADGTGITVIGLNAIGGYQPSISIPAIIEGKPVVKIGKNIESVNDISELGSFNSKFIKTVIIPESVKEIGDWAFFGCSALEEVVFVGDTVTSIGKGAFAGCVSLKEISLPNNLTGIKEFAFAGIAVDGEQSAEKEGLPEGDWKQVDMKISSVLSTKTSKLSSIGNHAFYNCPSLESITLSAVMRVFNYSAFYGSGIKAINFYEGGFLVGIDGVVYSRTGEVLYYYPLHGKSEYSMPSSVTKIAPYAFFDNDSITDIVFSPSLAEIGKYAFNGCNLLSHIYSKDSAVESVGAYAFEGCNSLEEIILPESLTNMGERVFASCEKLSSIAFKGEKLISIGDYAFYECKSLREITIPEGVTSIGKYAFNNCLVLTNVVFNGRSKFVSIDDYAFYECTSLGSVLLPSSLEMIGKYAFASENGRMEFEFESECDLSKIKYIGDYAFMNTQVSAVNISGKIANNGDLGKYVFKNCTSLKQAFFSPAGYNIVPEGLFYGCTSLNRIRFTSNLTVVDKYVFYNCSALEYAEFGSSVTEIRESAFEGCISLTNPGGERRVVPTGVVSIGKRAFYNCKSLESISIPSGLTVIEAESFYGCSSLVEINYDDGEQIHTIKENAFAYCSALQRATLPATLKGRNEDDTEGLVKNPFYGCNQLQEFVFSGATDGNLFIENGVLYRTLKKNAEPTENATERAICAYPTAKSSSTFVVSTMVSQIDRYAFFGCMVKGLSFARNTEAGGVENIVLVSIGDYAFAETSLIEVSLSFRVYKVGVGAFARSKLNALTIESDYIYDGKTGYSIINTDISDSDNMLIIDNYAFSETALADFTAPERVISLGDGALAFNYNLTNVVLNGGELTNLSLGARVFESDIFLTEIVLPNSTELIGEYAFYRCSNLKKVTFINGGRAELTIGNHAFSEAHSLYQITFPENIVSIGEGVFGGNTRLKYVYFPSNLTMASELSLSDEMFIGMSRMKEITIPSYITHIGNGAFKETSLESISFLGDETSLDLSIGEEAFMSLTTLESINLPANLVSIGDRAFAYSALCNVEYGLGKDMVIGQEVFKDSKITEFEVTSRVISIEEGCFRDNELLTEFTISGSLSEIPNYAFYDCKNLTDVNFGAGILSIGDSSFYGSGITELQTDSIIEVGENAFTLSEINSVAVNSASINIKKNAFANAKNLENVIITVDGSVVIGERAFENTSKMTTLSITGSNVLLGEAFASGANALGTGFNLTENSDEKNYLFNITENVVYSHDGKQFVYYPAGKSGSTFTLDENVKSIADYAFYGNEGLTRLIINGNDVTKGKNTFAEMGGNLIIYVPQSERDTYRNAWQMSNIESNVTVLEGFVLTVLSSGEYGVTGYLGTEKDIIINGKMTEGDRDYTVSSIEENAFSNNSVIESVIIGNGIKTIASRAFKNCFNLRSVEIGENITGIKSYAFYNCSKLTSVTFAEGSSLIGIGNHAFAYNSSLTEISIPDSVETIGLFAFAQDVSLLEINMQNGVTEIGNNAFEGCKNLYYAIIPKSVKKLGSYVFSGCDNLVYLDMKNGNVSRIEQNTFEGIPESVYFFVPDSTSENAYKTDEIWRRYIEKILSAMERRTEVGFENYVLKLRQDGEGYELLAYLGTESEVTIQSDVSDTVKLTSIGEYAIGKFAVKVVLSDGVNTIKDRAFRNAKSLTEIYLPSSLKKVGNYAFAYLDGLTKVEIKDEIDNPSMLESVGAYAFYECYGLTEIILPQTVREIKEYALSCPHDKAMNLNKLTFKHDAVSGTDSYGNNVVLKIGDYAFANNSQILSVVFNCKVSTIGDGAFANCSQMEELYLNYNPKNLTDVVTVIDEASQNVFFGCNKLSIFLPTTAITNRYSDTWTNNLDRHKLSSTGYVDADGFVYAITSSTNKQVTVINYLGTETEVYFPTETQIGQEMYTVVRIGRERYGTSEEINGYIIGNNVKKVFVPNGVLTIGEDAFRNSKNLVSVELGSGITTIEGHAFAGCKKLTTINIPLSVTQISSYAFYDCDRLGSGLTFSESIAPPTVPYLVIGGYAFAECDSLKEVYIPNHTKIIGGYRSTGSTDTGHTFENCINLKKIEFSDNTMITAIEGYSIKGTQIEEIELPTSIETVADYAFAECMTLRTVTILREIGSGITSATTTGENVFYGILNPHIKIYVPESTFDIYSSARGWKGKTVIKNNITPDGKFAYEIDGTGENSYLKLTDYRGKDSIVEIPRLLTLQSRDYYVTTIGKYFGNKDIKKVIFQAGSFVTELKEYAFAGCTALEEIRLPDGITNIGQHGFDGCTALKDIKLPESLTEVKEFTFYNCASIEEITLPKEIQGIGPSAFYRCSSLSRVIVEFGEYLTESNVGASLGVSAFGDAGISAGGLAIIVPSEKYAIFHSGWIAVRDNIYSADDVVGDYLIDVNERGTALKILQYLGTEKVVDLTELKIMGLFAEEIGENAVKSSETVFIIDEKIKYPNELCDRIITKE